MKREYIKKLLPEITDEALDAIMEEHGKGIEAHKAAAAQLTTERDGLKAQLEAASTEIQSYKDMDIDGIRAKVGDWESKYHADTQNLKAQLEAAEYGFAAKEAAGGIPFTSESARKAFLADLTAQKLPLQEGKLLGWEDFRKAYQESDPGAFAAEDQGKIPVAVREAGGGVQAKGPENMTYTELCAYLAGNPGASM